MFEKLERGLSFTQSSVELIHIVIADSPQRLWLPGFTSFTSEKNRTDKLKENNYFPQVRYNLFSMEYLGFSHFTLRSSKTLHLPSSSVCPSSYYLEHSMIHNVDNALSLAIVSISFPKQDPGSYS